MLDTFFFFSLELWVFFKSSHVDDCFFTYMNSEVCLLVK